MDLDSPIDVRLYHDVALIRYRAQLDIDVQGRHIRVPPYAVNDDGQVVGNSCTYINTIAGSVVVGHPFSWSAAGGMIDLAGTVAEPYGAGATAVNGAGQVIGTGRRPSSDAFSWTAAGGMVELGTLGGY
jgi:probable HAF family extracellular repeat protein